MTYNPKVKLYYYNGTDTADETNRLVPAPLISIAPEYYYANDTVIGYTNQITLKGYVTSLDLRDTPTSNPGFSGVLESIKTTKNILNRNGGTLEVVDAEGTLLKATGGIIRELNFDQGSNNWNNYGEYSASIEFNEVQYGDCLGEGSIISCSGIPEGYTDSPLLLDMKQYRVKSMNDNWTFNVNEDAYNTYDGIKNEFIQITYTVSAQGKHYWNGENLIPAWEQAKNFCQYRVHQQVTRLIGGILKRTADTACGTGGTLSTIFGAGPDGLLDGLDNADYNIYNETITCNTSEKEGNFEATYSAILKRDYSFSFNNPDTIHTFTVNKTVVNDGKQKNTQIGVEGNIRGLIPGGLIQQSGIVSFPNTGTILVTGSPSTNRYDNASTGYDLIGTRRSLNDDFLAYLGVNNASLGVSGVCIDPSGIPEPISHNLVHNYVEGSINYSSSYDTISAGRKAKPYQNLTINVQEKTPIIAEFIVPGKSGGPVIQNLNCYNPKRVTINMDGLLPASGCCDSPADLVNAACAQLIAFSGIPDITLPNSKLTENKYTKGTDGSFSITKSFVIYDTGP
jgi:hypothetical protein